MSSGRGLRRVGVIAWIALIVIVAIWTEHHIADRSATPTVRDEPRAAPPRPRRAAMPRASLAATGAATAVPLRLEGHVIGPDGRDIEGASVGLGIERDSGAAGFPWLRRTATPAGRTTSDAAGRFAFDSVEPRSYIVTATTGALIAEPVRYTARDASPPLVLRLIAGASATVTVTDEARAPIPAARIEISGESLTTVETDAQGRATVAPIRPGFAGITAVAPGFAPEYRDVQLGSSDAHADVAITLYRGVPVSGRVIDDGRQPIAGAWITLSGRRTDITGTSDDRGEFSFPAVVRGPYTILVTADDHLPSRTPISVERTAVSGVEIAMAPGAMITGVVVDAGHHPVPRATVTAYVHGIGMQTASDAGGSFELRGIPAGSVVLRAETAAAQTRAVYTTISAASDAPDIELTLEFTGAIAGIVVDDHGAPLAGIPITAHPDYSRPSRPGEVATHGHAISDDTGAFTVTGLSDGVFVVSANPGHLPSARWPPPDTASTRTGDRDVRLVVPSPGHVTGRLVDDGGAPIGNATVSLGFHSARTSGDGAFDIRNVVPGPYLVYARVADAVDRVGSTDVRPGETDLGTLTAPRSHTRALAGRVVDAAGVPIGNVRVELGVIRPPPVDEDDPPGGFHAHRTAYTAPDGLFRIPDIPPTPMLARATDPAYRESAMIALPTAAACPGDPPAITLVLPPRDR